MESSGLKGHKVAFQMRKLSLLVTVGVGLLCTLLLADVTSANPLQTCNNEERRVLEARLSKLAAEKDQLQQSYDKLKEEKDQLQITYDKVQKNIHNQTNQLQTNVTDLQRENDELLNVTRKILIGCVSMKIDSNRLERSYSLLQAEKELLQTNFDALESNRNELKAHCSILGKAAKELAEDYQDFLSKMEKKINSMKCPSGWIKFGSSCYFVSTVKKTWISSRQDCISRGGDLLIVNSVKEQAFANLILTSSDYAWIGMHDLAEEGTWVWVDRSAVTTTYWKEGQPNNYMVQDCGELVKTSSGVGEWNDEDCTKDQVYICEI